MTATATAPRAGDGRPDPPPGLGLRLALTAIPLHATYAQYLSQHCVTPRHPACRPAAEGSGRLVGASLMARDYETAAYRFGWSQGVSWRRQLAAKLLVTGAIVLVGSFLLGLSRCGTTTRPGGRGRTAAGRSGRLRAWLASRDIACWIGYQPASGYWLFQAATAVILVTLAAAAGLLAAAAASRRA